ncbi:hypothetical protein E8E13_004304 [Curvularia kusanoi]|uniref:AB hydrolase-1 domain-containing protein n=1 Tax=Curvularia kusanoi TaxID=90978 RepID=A0A9P4THU8_CURKU|nr:hypothetical protein E8E13_004304 [Curvularia kusanoi]
MAILQTISLGLLLLISYAAATTSKPALILVPGAFHRASVYDTVSRQLHNAGYTHIDAVELPSLGYSATGVERTADVEAVTQLLSQRLHLDGDDVILVGNSYGATVIMEAVKDFEAYSSALGPRTPNSAQILGLIMLSGYIPTITSVTSPATHLDVRAVSPSYFSFHPSPPSKNTTAPSLVTWDLDLATYPPSHTFYNLLNASAAAYWTSQLLPTSFEALNATGTYIAYGGRFRTLYVVAEFDNCVGPEFAWAYVEQEGARFEVEVLEADHVPMLSRPREVVDVVRRFAGERVGRGTSV